MSEIIRIVYSSAASSAFTDAALRELLARTRKKNAAAGVTGILLHVDRSFLQVLEGEPSVLEPLYATIAYDRRHSDIVKIIQEPITQRDFSDWSMGLARVTAKEFATAAGLNDFFGAGSSLRQVREGNARKVLSAFNEGRWRARVA